MLAASKMKMSGSEKKAKLGTQATFFSWAHTCTQEP